jgi:hypothetical protein
MSVSQRRDCGPVLVQTSGEAMPLERIPFTERRLEEGWLQRLLYDCLTILPVGDLDPGVVPLIPIGREIATECEEFFHVGCLHDLAQVHHSHPVADVLHD